jgi:hypothetical protein
MAIVRLKPNFDHDLPFDKKSIIERIKQELPEPWVWYTIGSCMEDDTVYPTYDLIIIRNKDVIEEVNYSRTFSSMTKSMNNVYSIVLGINIVEKFSSPKEFDVPESTGLVTAGVEINSAATLFEIIKKVESKDGGISNVK